MFAREFEDFQSFSCAEFAGLCPKGFYCGKRFVLPKYVHFESDVVLDFLLLGFSGNEAGEVASKRIRALVLENQLLHVLDMLLDPFLYVLLSIANVLLAGFEAGGFVDHDGTSAEASVGAGFTVPAVTVQIFKIQGS